MCWTQEMFNIFFVTINHGQSLLRGQAAEDCSSLGSCFSSLWSWWLLKHFRSRNTVSIIFALPAINLPIYSYQLHTWERWNMHFNVSRRRGSVWDCLNHPWIFPRIPDDILLRQSNEINMDNLRNYQARKRWKVSDLLVTSDDDYLELINDDEAYDYYFSTPWRWYSSATGCLAPSSGAAGRPCWMLVMVETLRRSTSSATTIISQPRSETTILVLER